MKLFKFGGKESKSKIPEKIHEHKYEEPVATYKMTEKIDPYKEMKFKVKQGWNAEEIGLMHNEV